MIAACENWEKSLLDVPPNIANSAPLPGRGMTKQMNIAKICFAAGLLALSPSPIRVQPGAADSAVILLNSDIGMKVMGPVLEQFGAGMQLLQTIRSFME